MTVNGSSVALDSPAQIMNNRTMLPMRAIAERLGKKVYWNDAGLIVIGDSSEVFAEDEDYMVKDLADRMSTYCMKITGVVKHDENRADTPNTPADDNQGGQPPLIEADQDNTEIDNGKDTFTIGFIGGSLTQGGATWTNAVKDFFAKKYPDKNIATINAGVGGTGSWLGILRIQKDILQFDPDLVVIEFAVNDTGESEADTKGYMEGMIRQCVQSESSPRVLLVEAPQPVGKDEEKYQKWSDGVKWKEEIADYYGLKSINIYDYMYAEFEKMQEENSDFTWYDYLSQYYSKEGTGFNVHGGYEKYAEAIVKELNEDFARCFKKPLDKAVMTDPEVAELKCRMIYACLLYTSDAADEL